MHNLTSLNHVKNEEEERSDENKAKKRKLNDDLEPFYKDIVETSALCLYDKTNLGNFVSVFVVYIFEHKHFSHA